MRFDKTEGSRINQRELCDVKPFVEILQKKSYNGVTHPNIECVKEATWEELGCNSQR